MNDAFTPLVTLRNQWSQLTTWRLISFAWLRCNFQTIHLWFTHMVDDVIIQNRYVCYRHYGTLRSNFSQFDSGQRSKKNWSKIFGKPLKTCKYPELGVQTVCKHPMILYRKKIFGSLYPQIVQISRLAIIWLLYCEPC